MRCDGCSDLKDSISCSAVWTSRATKWSSSSLLAWNRYAVDDASYERRTGRRGTTAPGSSTEWWPELVAINRDAHKLVFTGGLPDGVSTHGMTNFIGLGPCVIVARNPTWCITENRNPTAMPTDSFTFVAWLVMP